MATRRGNRRRRWGITAAAFVVLALGLQGCSFGPTDPAAQFDPVDAQLGPETADALQGVLEQAVALTGASGGIAGVWAPWAGEWTAATGTVSFDEGAAATTVGTPFRMGTLTSELTCAIVLKLVDDGQLELSDEVADDVDWIPSLDGITYEQLCRHNSGVADYYANLEGIFLTNPVRTWSNNELVAAGMGLARTGAPGATVKESRTGVLLAAMGIERHTGKSWEELAEQYVFEPLGIDDTSIPAPDDQGRGLLGAYSSALTGDGKVDCATRLDQSDQSTSMGAEAAGATTTLEDLRRFSEAFATGALLSDSVKADQWDVQPVAGAPQSWYGAGIGGASYGPMRGDVSETAGMLTAALTDASSGLTVVLVLNNSSSTDAFVREAAFALASIGSKADAAAGAEAPLVELPWSLEQATTNMTKLAACPPPAT
ncbi:serine hydrolase domain-containing protein [Agromyces allii]|uniref:Beta-lactamase-related domain-containing protein n=1 Tax=Agromyces allii TaxID=393607 RepID=A0ABN2QTS2_9MICO|nr:serine hydrolase domain-containing protein [Agromyces allii]